MSGKNEHVWSQFHFIVTIPDLRLKWIPLRKTHHQTVFHHTQCQMAKIMYDPQFSWWNSSLSSLCFCGCLSTSYHGNAMAPAAMAAVGESGETWWRIIGMKARTYVRLRMYVRMCTNVHVCIHIRIRYTSTDLCIRMYKYVNM
jgi:hypothetical protein